MEINDTLPNDECVREKNQEHKESSVKRKERNSKISGTKWKLKHNTSGAH